MMDTIDVCEVTLGLFALQIHDWSIAELITRPEYRLLVASCQKYSVSLLKFILSHSAQNICHEHVKKILFVFICHTQWIGCAAQSKKVYISNIAVKIHPKIGANSVSKFP